MSDNPTQSKNAQAKPRPPCFGDETDLSKNLRAKSLKAGGYTVAGQALRIVIQLMGTAVLARLLVPEDFGLVAMVAALVSFAQMFKDAGLSTATVQREQITHDQISTLFWINIAISLGLTVFVWFLAPLISSFYGDPRLTPITLVVGISILLSGLGVQHQALLRRRFAFKSLAIADVSAQVFATVIGIILALIGAGYWSLVGMQLASHLCFAIMLFALLGWIPGKPRRGVGVRPMLVFGGQLSGARFINHLVRNLDSILIGKFWGADQLALYTKGYGLLMLPINQVSGPVSAVAIPGLSRLQGNPEKYRSYYRTVLMLSTALGMPIVVYAFLMTEEIILFVLGDQWHGTIPIFQALAPAAFLGTFNAAASWALVPVGRADKELRIGVYGGLFVVIAFFIGVQYGTLGVALAFSIATLIRFPLQISYAYRFSPVKGVDFLQATWRSMMCSLSAGAILYMLKFSYFLGNLFLSLFLAAIVYGFIYLLIWFLLPGGLAELRNVIGDRLFRRFV